MTVVAEVKGKIVQVQGAVVDIEFAPQPALGMLLAFGGNAKDSAFADADSWRHIRMFLAESFGEADTSAHDAPTVAP